MSFILLICLLSLLQAVELVTAQKQSSLDSKTNPCNINNYNSFYAGPSKKLENIILEMNRKLDAIQRELKNLTKKENKTKSKFFIPFLLFDLSFFTVILFRGKFVANS